MNETDHARWLAAALVALAKRCLKDAHNTDGRWPKDMEWTDLSGSSKGTFIQQACDEAGIPFVAVAAFQRGFDIDWDNPMK